MLDIWIHAAVHCLLGLFFSTKDGGITFLQNISKLLPDYMISHRMILFTVTTMINRKPIYFKSGANAPTIQKWVNCKYGGSGNRTVS
jgi:hypothetical protein